jgi:hypothetical protein
MTRKETFGRRGALVVYHVPQEYKHGVQKNGTELQTGSSHLRGHLRPPSILKLRDGRRVGESEDKVEPLRSSFETYP